VRLKKPLCGALSACLVFCAAFSVSVFAPHAAGTADAVLFFDDFTGAGTTSSRGWSTNCVVEDGAVRLSHSGINNAFLTGVSGFSAWTDYTVTATATITQTRPETVTASTAVFAIAGRYSGTRVSDPAYQFRISYNRNTAKWQANLVSSTAAGTNLATKDITGKADFHQSLTLKMEFSGSDITCFINGESILTYGSATAHTAGTAGMLLANGYDTLVDRFFVTKPGGNTVPEDAIFFDDFEQQTAAVLRGWSREIPVTDGQATLSHFPGQITNAHLTGVSGSAAWMDYVIEAKVTVTELRPETVTATGATFALAGHYNGTDSAVGSYQFRIQQSTRTRAWSAMFVTSTAAGVNIDSKAVSGLENNVPFNLKMVFSGTDIYCYINGTLTLSCENAELHTAGTAGMLIANCFDTNVDDFLVREVTVDDIPPVDHTPDGQLFFDDFSAGTAPSSRGWGSDPVVADNRLHLVPGGLSSVYLRNFPGANDWVNYAAEADLAVSAMGEMSGNTSAAAICARTSGTGNGYELGLCFMAAGGSYWRLYDRTNGVELARSAAVGLERGTVYHVKMLLFGNQIVCFADDVLLFNLELADDYHESGSVGLRTSGLEALVDYVLVRELNDGELPPLPLPSVPPEKPEGAWFWDDFGDASPASARGWSSDREVIEEKMRLTTSATSAYLTRLESATVWTDYVVQANVTVNTTDVLTSSTAAVSLAGRAPSSSGGYEFGICFSATSSYLRLYDRANAKIIATNYDYLLERGKTYQLRSVFFRDRVLCYLNGRLVFNVIDSGNAVGTIGLRVAQYGADFDNVLVRGVTEDDLVPLPQPTPEGELWFFDDFNDADTMTEKGWNRDTVAISDGRVTLTDPDWTLFLTGVPGCFTWQNYIVETFVTLEKDSPFLGTGSTAVAALVAFANENLLGYEFGLCVNASGVSYARLYQRETGVELVRNTDVTVNRGETYALRMVAFGGRLLCFINGKKVIEVEASAGLAGTAGIRAGLVSAFFDDFFVRTATAEDLYDYVVVAPGVPGFPGGNINPPTGSAACPAIWFFATLSAFAAFYFTRKRKYMED
jgi:hypothetical protein